MGLEASLWPEVADALQRDALHATALHRVEAMQRALDQVAAARPTRLAGILAAYFSVLPDSCDSVEVVRRAIAEVT